MRLDLALAVDRDDLGVGIEIGDLGRTEIKHRPARGIMHGPSQRLGEAWPGQADFDDRILEMHRRQPRGTEPPVLLLRVLQDQEFDPAFDRRNAVADAERQRLAAMRTVRDRLFGDARLRDAGLGDAGPGIGLF